MAHEMTAQEQAAFDREAYLGLADEFDPMGATSDPELLDFEPVYVEAARRFASQLAIPLPWEVRSLDNAARYVQAAERRLAEMER